MFNDLLDETKSFKYKITVKIVLKKYKRTEIDFPPVYFNSTTKSVILKKLFKKFYTAFKDELMKDLVGLLNQLILNTLIFQLFDLYQKSSYIKLPVELRNSKKGLINIKNYDQKCILWCHIRQLNPLKIRSEKITQHDKKLSDNLDYEEIDFPVSKNN